MIRIWCLATTLILATAIWASVGYSPSLARPDGPTIAETFGGDVDQLCRLVADHYAYFETRAGHWRETCRLARIEAGAARGNQDGLAVLERLTDELHDPHASLGTNSAGSPRLIPSGSDVWIEIQDGKFEIVAVRRDGSADRHGLRAGDRLIAANGKPPREAARARIRTAPDEIPKQRLEWASNAVVAGYRDKPRLLTYRRDGQVIKVALGDPEPAPRSRPLDWAMLDGNIGYVRLNNSLGNRRTVALFDKALEELRSASGWILDLRETPGGGNTDVAEPIMGRFISHALPYQRILPIDGEAYDRRVAPRGPWTARGPVVVVVGRWTGSMGEGIAIGFDGMGRGRVIGSKMAGLAGGTESFDLAGTGIPVRFPTYGLAHLDGTPRHEWLPPQMVTADPGGNTDVALTAAKTWIRAQQ